MTVCTNGTQRKTGVPDYALLSGRAFRQWFLDKYSRLSGATSLMPPDEVAEVDALCASEITVPTPPTLENWLKWLVFLPPHHEIVQTYLRQLWLSEQWASYCECAPLGSAAWREIYRNCSTQIYSGSGALPSPVLVYTPVAGDTQVKLWAYCGSGCTGYSSYVFAYFMNASNVEISHMGGGSGSYLWYPDVGAPPGGVPVFGPTSIPAGTHHINLHVFNYNAAAPSGCCARGIMQVNGTAQPYTPVAPVDDTDVPDVPAATCSTTADICTRLNQIEAILRFTDRSVAWLQGSLSPDSWSPGTTVSGLTGHGSIAVEGILGLFVSASVPSSWGETYEHPARLLPAIGSVQWSIDGVPMESQLVHYDEQHIFGAPAATDEVLYNFKNGVTASITPLLRAK